MLAERITGEGYARETDDARVRWRAIFHNGSAHTLNDVADFYNTRFSIGLTDDKADLIAFLNAM